MSEYRRRSSTAPMSSEAIDISVVIHRVRVVTVSGVPDERRGDQRADARGSDTERETLLDGVPSALSAYRLEVP
jgi:hypothetical protein